MGELERSLSGLTGRVAILSLFECAYVMRTYCVWANMNVCYLSCLSKVYAYVMQ